MHSCKDDWVRMKFESNKASLHCEEDEQYASPPHFYVDYKLPEVSHELSRRARESPLTMAVVGCAGQGKSSLVNSLLRLEANSKNAAKVGGIGETTTEHVRFHDTIRDGATIHIWDTPGLDDSSHVKQRTVINELREKAGNNLDLVLYCIAYYPGVMVNEGHRKVISYLTENFGKELWKRVRFILTMVNTAWPHTRKAIPIQKRNIEKNLKQALRDAKVEEGMVEKHVLILAGYGEEKLMVDDQKEISWNEELFQECLNALNEEGKIVLTQARCGENEWNGILTEPEDNTEEDTTGKAEDGGRADAEVDSYIGAKEKAGFGAVNGTQGDAVGAGVGTTAAGGGAESTTGAGGGAESTTGAGGGAESTTGAGGGTESTTGAGIGAEKGNTTNTNVYTGTGALAGAGIGAGVFIGVKAWIIKGAAIGSLAGPKGTIIGGVTGAVTGLVTGGVIGRKIANYASKEAKKKKEAKEIKEAKEAKEKTE